MLPELDLSSPGAALISSAVVGFVVGLIPIGLAEVAAVAIGALQPTPLALAALGVFTVAHVAGKLPWYALGRLGDRVRHPGARRRLEQAREYLARHPGYGFGLLGLSAFASVPPFHLAAIAAGIVRMPLLPVLLVCITGRALRFGLLFALPVVIRALSD